jgi:hypothetical protein
MQLAKCLVAVGLLATTGSAFSQGFSVTGSLAVLGDEELALVDPKSYQVIRVVEGLRLRDGPTEISTDGRWALTVVKGRDEVRLTDLEKHESTKEVQVPWAPQPVAAFASSDLRTAWILSAGLKALIECDTTSWTPKRRLALAGLAPLRAMHQGDRVLVETESSVSELDLTQFQVLRTETVLGSIQDLDWSARDGHEAMKIERSGGRKVWEFNRTAAGWVTDFIPAVDGLVRLWHGSLGAISSSKVTGQIWASKLSKGSNPWSHTYSECPADFDSAPDGGKLFLALHQSKLLIVADMDNGSEVAKVVLPFAPEKLQWVGSP